MVSYGQCNLARGENIGRSYGYTVLLNYNFIFTYVSTRGAMRKLQCILVMCLRGPRFLVAWNIYVSCNLPCATCRIAMGGITTHGIAVCGIAT